MFVLQRVQDGVFHFSAHDTKADVFAEVRSNYGLNESEFFEFLSQTYYERPNLYLTVYEGEIPAPEQNLRAKAAQKAQLARKQAK